MVVTKGKDSVDYELYKPIFKDALKAFLGKEIILEASFFEDTLSPFKCSEVFFKEPLGNDFRNCYKIVCTFSSLSYWFHADRPEEMEDPEHGYVLEIFCNENDKEKPTIAVGRTLDYPFDKALTQVFSRGEKDISK